MTREEAIQYLQPIADSASMKRYSEALGVAIAALREQEPVTNRNGLNCTESNAVKVVESDQFKPGWISVEDRLPDDSAGVNLCTRSGIVGTGFYDKYTKNWVQYYSGGALCVDVTHWMPLPEPPEVQP